MPPCGGARAGGDSRLCGGARAGGSEKASYVDSRPANASYRHAGTDVTIRDDLGRNAAARVPDGGEMEKLRARLARAAASKEPRYRPSETVTLVIQPPVSLAGNR